MNRDLFNSAGLVSFCCWNKVNSSTGNWVGTRASLVNSDQSVGTGGWICTHANSRWSGHLAAAGWATSQAMQGSNKSSSLTPAAWKQDTYVCQCHHSLGVTQWASGANIVHKNSSLQHRDQIARCRERGRVTTVTSKTTSQDRAVESCLQSLLIEAEGVFLSVYILLPMTMRQFSQLQFSTVENTKYETWVLVPHPSRLFFARSIHSGIGPIFLWRSFKLDPTVHLDCELRICFEDYEWQLYFGSVQVRVNGKFWIWVMDETGLNSIWCYYGIWMWRYGISRKLSLWLRWCISHDRLQKLCGTLWSAMNLDPTDLISQIFVVTKMHADAHSLYLTKCRQTAIRPLIHRITVVRNLSKL